MIASHRPVLSATTRLHAGSGRGSRRRVATTRGHQRSNTRSIRTRLSALAAMAGGLGWIVVGVLQLTGGDEFSTDAIETVAEHAMMGFLAAALVLTAPAVLALTRQARTRRPRYVAVIDADDLPAKAGDDFRLS
jgi:hypothetical protein